MATSTVPTLKANLKAALDAKVSDGTNALYNVQVTYGIPLPAPEREYVWLGDVDGHQDWAAIGKLRRAEEYDLSVFIHVTTEGTESLQSATERAFAIAAAIETVLRNDPTVSGAVIVAGYGGHIRMRELSSKDGMRRGCDLETTIHCQARI